MDEELLNEKSLSRVFRFMDSGAEGKLTFDDMWKSLIRRGHIFSSTAKEAYSIEEIMAKAGIESSQN